MGRQKKLITIHGVNPDAWQDAVRPLFEPHFEFVALRYPDYDGVSGPVRVVCHPVLLALATGATLVSAAAALWLRAWALPALGVGAVAFAVGLAIAALQRRSRVARTKRELSQHSASGPRPHVIAHSFGTYLTGQALKHPELSFDRVVLVGSPLPRDYDWGTLQSHGRRAFATVRNEMGTRDPVVRLAGRARFLTPDLGDAGLRGFLPGPHVHDLDGPWDTCGTCAAAAGAGVHNVPLREMGHSDVFLGPGHAKRLWLPFLWGYPPTEFDRYLLLCHDANLYLAGGLSYEFNLVLHELAETSWSWTEGRPLRAFVSDVAAHMAAGLPAARVQDAGGQAQVTREALLLVCQLTTLAEEEHATATQRRALHPRVAIAIAVEATLARIP